MLLRLFLRMGENKNCYLTIMRKSVHSQFRVIPRPRMVRSQKMSVSKIRVTCPTIVAA